MNARKKKNSPNTFGSTMMMCSKWTIACFLIQENVPSDKHILLPIYLSHLQCCTFQHQIFSYMWYMFTLSFVIRHLKCIIYFISYSLKGNLTRLLKVHTLSTGLNVFCTNINAEINLDITSWYNQLMLECSVKK